MLVFLSFAAAAVPNPYDYQIGPREYNEMISLVQSPKNESNSNLVRAFLSWAVSPEDHSVYLAVQYHCSDHTAEDGMTGVIVFVNGEKIGTVYPNTAAECILDNDRFKLDGWLDDGAWGPPYDSFCEARVGLKFWPDGEIKAGVQILDFTGNYSNYYEETVYSPYTTTTTTAPAPANTDSSAKETPRSAAQEKTTKEKTTTEKSTTAKTTTVKAADTTAAATIGSTTRNAAPAITASPKPETTAGKTAASSAAVTSARTEPETTADRKSADRKNDDGKTEADSYARRKKTTAPSTTQAPPVEETTAEMMRAALNETGLSETTSVEPTATGTVPAAVTGVQMYSEMNKVKIVGTVLVAVILTAAIMSSVFLGMRRKDEPAASPAPQEEHDDFG